MALDEKLDEALGKQRDLGFFERKRLRRRIWKNRRDVLKDAFNGFIDVETGGKERIEWGSDDDDNTPFLDFWKWLIEGERIQKFMTFLVEVFLPQLFNLIMMFIVL